MTFFFECDSGFWLIPQWRKHGPVCRIFWLWFGVGWITMGFGQFITGFGRAVQDDIRKEISQKEAGNG